jgi:hypothetical protein
VDGISQEIELIRKKKTCAAFVDIIERKDVGTKPKSNKVRFFFGVHEFMSDVQVTVDDLDYLDGPPSLSVPTTPKRIRNTPLYEYSKLNNLALGKIPLSDSIILFHYPFTILPFYY